jgi:hypothetical protein
MLSLTLPFPTTYASTPPSWMTDPTVLYSFGPGAPREPAGQHDILGGTVILEALRARQCIKWFLDSHTGCKKGGFLFVGTCTRPKHQDRTSPWAPCGPPQPWQRNTAVPTSSTHTQSACVGVSDLRRDDDRFTYTAGVPRYTSCHHALEDERFGFSWWRASWRQQQWGTRGHGHTGEPIDRATAIRCAERL